MSKLMETVHVLLAAKMRASRIIDIAMARSARYVELT